MFQDAATTPTKGAIDPLPPPAQLGVGFYKDIGRAQELAHCRRCGHAFSSRMHIEDLIEVENGVGFLTIRGTPKSKVGLDTLSGWMAYLPPDGLLFAKRFATFPGRRYADIPGLTQAFWYGPEGRYVELEPLGPEEVLAPGASAAPDYSQPGPHGVVTRLTDLHDTRRLPFDVRTSGGERWSKQHTAGPCSPTRPPRPASASASWRSWV